MLCLFAKKTTLSLTGITLADLLKVMSYIYILRKWEENTLQCNVHSVVLFNKNPM